MDSDAVLGKKEITSKELLSLIANRVHKSDSSAESCLSAYKSVSPPRGSTFYDLAALYTRALVSILRSSPRNLPLPREHIRTLHNSLPTSAQASLLSVRSAVIADYKDDSFASAAPKKLLQSLIEAQDAYCLLASDIASATGTILNY